MRIIIISDLHIGACDSDRKAITKFLSQLRCDKLIMAGDIWELWRYPEDHLRDNYQDIITLFEDIRRRGTEIIYLEGNHDGPNKIIDIPQLQSYDFKLDDHNIVIIHGHEFDVWIKKLLQPIAFWIGSMLCSLLGKFYKKLRITSKLQARRLKDKALKRYDEYDLVITGHSHYPEVSQGYVNCGDWKGHNTYIEISNSKLALHRFE